MKNISRPNILFPQGYGVPEHLAAIARYGPSSIHRRSFEPVKGILGWSREVAFPSAAGLQQPKATKEKKKRTRS